MIHLIDTSSPIYILLVILISVLAIFLVFLLTGWIPWAILLRIEKKVYKSFNNVIPLEEKRKEIVKETISYVKKRKYKYNKELIQNIEDKIQPSFDNPKDAIPVKDGMDIGIVYLTKLLTTYGDSEKDEVLIEKMKNANDESDKVYNEFSKVAARYNAIFLMPSTKLVNKLHRKKNRRTRISYM